jgi:4-diphosphocytidyl-2-C-methyl-D-erythritol kinase
MERLAARAKINLFLDVKEKRPDGYHEVSTVMQSITLADLIELSVNETNPQVIYADSPACDFHDDIIIKSWQALRARTGLDMPFTAMVRKVIPVAAGLGGGSADAAATLVGLNSLFGLGLSDADLVEIAADIGADVPFFIAGGTAIGTGAGEIIKPADAMPDCAIVIIKPKTNISTARAYQDYDDFIEGGGTIARDGNIQGMLSALAASDYKDVCAALFNSFEPAIFAKHPEIAAAKQAALDDGADAALMSGSGSTIFALTRDPKTAGVIAKNAAANGAASHIVKPCNTAIVALS